MSNLHNAVREMFDNEDLENIANQGCAAACPGGLIYYNETSDFYDKYEDEILNTIYGDYESVLEDICTAPVHIIKNYRVWAAVEAVAQQLLDEVQS